MIAPTKLCRMCGVEKPRSAFDARTRNPDGSVRWVRAYCRPCDRKRRLDLQRRKRADLRKDPVAWEAWRKEQNAYLAAYKRRRRRERKAWKAAEEWVPAMPLALAIEAEAKRRNPFGHAHDGALVSVCDLCGVSDRTFRFWRAGERELCEFGVADRVLIGLDLLWWEVWPPERFPAVAAMFDREEVAA